MAKKQSADAPQTVTVYNTKGQPCVEIKVGDDGSARAVASTYERRGMTVQITPAAR